MNQDPRGTIVEQGNTMRINPALIEEVSCTDNSGGHIIVSYSVPDRNQGVSIQKLRLNVNENTSILGPRGQNMCLCCLQPGMLVNVIFSSRMTRSIPPQSNAFLITVQRTAKPSSFVSAGRIVLIDFDSRTFITEDLPDRRSQTRYVTTDTTTFTNLAGAPIRFTMLHPGQRVRVTHAAFQTASIPPQTTAFHVQII